MHASRPAFVYVYLHPTPACRPSLIVHIAAARCVLQLLQLLQLAALSTLSYMYGCVVLVVEGGCRVCGSRSNFVDVISAGCSQSSGTGVSLIAFAGVVRSGPPQALKHQPTTMLQSSQHPLAADKLSAFRLNGTADTENCSTVCSEPRSDSVTGYVGCCTVQH